MPHADPDAAAAYRAGWEARNPGWRARYADRRRLPPVSRQQVLDQDIAQQGELARLEGRLIGHQRAQARLLEWVRTERRWIRNTFQQEVDDDVNFDREVLKGLTREELEGVREMIDTELQTCIVCRNIGAFAVLARETRGQRREGWLLICEPCWSVEEPGHEEPYPGVTRDSLSPILTEVSCHRPRPARSEGRSRGSGLYPGPIARRSSP